MSVQFERKVLVNLRATDSVSWGKPVLNSLFSLGSCPYVQFLATSRWTRYWESAFYALPAAPNGSFCYLGCRRRTYVWPIIALSEFNDFATMHFIGARSKRHPSDGPFWRNGSLHRSRRWHCPHGVLPARWRISVIISQPEKHLWTAAAFYSVLVRVRPEGVRKYSTPSANTPSGSVSTAP